MLARSNLGRIRSTFTLCYEFVAGHNKALKDDLSKVLDEQRGISKEAAVTLYRHYIWDIDRRNLETQRSEAAPSNDRDPHRSR